MILYIDNILLIKHLYTNRYGPLARHESKTNCRHVRAKIAEMINSQYIEIVGLIFSLF
jgi:hypothetical protein